MLIVRRLFLQEEGDELNDEQHDSADSCPGPGQYLVKPCNGKQYEEEQGL